MATIAAHQFPGQKSSGDAVALSIYSSKVYFLDQETLDRKIPVENSDGYPLADVLSEDGFTTDTSRLRFPIDAYNRESRLYRGETGDALHPDILLNITL